MRTRAADPAAGTATRERSGSSRARAENSRDRQLDVAIEKAQQALELFARSAEGADQALARLLAEIGACIGEPARARRAMHAIELREIVDRQLVEDVLAQQVALANLERGERFADRLLELGGVGRADVLALGIVRAAAARPVIEQDLVERLLA